MARFHPLSSILLGTIATGLGTLVPSLVAEAATMTYNFISQPQTWQGTIEFDSENFEYLTIDEPGNPPFFDPNLKLFESKFEIKGNIPGVGAWQWQTSTAILSEYNVGNGTFDYDLWLNIPFAAAPPQADPFFNGAQDLILNFSFNPLIGQGQGGLSWSGDGWMLSFPLDGPGPGVPYKYPITVASVDPATVPEPTSAFSLLLLTGISLAGCLKCQQKPGT